MRIMDCICGARMTASDASSLFDAVRRHWEQNRADKLALIERGEAQGLLAYAGDRVVAWCHAAPRRTLPMFDRNPRFPADDAKRVGSIVCFVVGPRYRGQGIAKALLDAACDALRDQGLSIAEGYPLKSAESAARAHLGTQKMYESAGFTLHHDAGHAVVMRKPL